MNTNTSSKPPSNWSSVVRNTLAAVALTGLGMGSAMAAAPLAGTTIGNQAAATYTDASAITRTATSNTVTTIVQQVAALTLTASQSQSAAPGAPVNFPHTITNNGNGTDSFNLTSTANAGTMTLPNPVFYIDANCNGVADNATAITSITGVAPGATACFIAVSTAPVAGTSGQNDSFAVVATSALTAGVTQSNTDTVTITAQAVVNVTKAVSLSSGPTGTTVTYTLTYTNTGNAAATSVILSDVLPAGMNYVAGTAKLNGSAVTDTVDGDAFDYNVAATRALAVVPTVAAGQSGQLSFDAIVANGTLPGPLNNQARYCYNDGLAVQPVTTCTATNASTSPTAGSGNPTNAASFNVLQTAAVAANESLTNTTIGGVTDTVTVASASQGATVVFNDYVHNNGNGVDTFNLSLTPSSFPTGTTFLLFKSDGVTPLTDTNAIPDGVVDTGPVPAGTAYLVVVKAVLPSGVSGGGAYANVLTAKSSFNPAQSDTVNNSLTTIAANSVDLTNGAPVATATLAQGLGANTGTATPVAVNPGSKATYPLYVNNTSGIADTYSMSSTALPTGWTVEYFADNSGGACTTLGGTVTNTGIITAGANKVVCAVVTTPSNATPGTTPVTFTVRSPTTGAQDTKAESVSINTVRSVTLNPPNAGQVFPSGSVVYTHILTNNGNVIEADGTNSTVTLTAPTSGMTAGWNNIVYLDNGGTPGALDPTDTVVSGATLPVSLAPGASVRLFVKVLAPASSAAGDINTSSLTATTANVAYITTVPPAVVAADTTTVIVGQVTLSKTQALDALCDGVADTAFSNASISAGAIPGACVMYQITATNVGTANVSSVVVSDATPANTTYKSYAAATGTAPAAATSVGTVATAPVAADGLAATITATVGTLTPGQSALISFAVRINP